MTASPIPSDKPEPMVFGFHRPHRIGSICNGANCAQCCMPGVGIVGKFVDAHLKDLPETPFYIVGEATREDWARAVIANGGIVREEAAYPCYYFVTTD